MQSVRFTAIARLWLAVPWLRPSHPLFAIPSLCLAALFHRLSRQCFSAAILRILCRHISALSFALAHQCFALASQCHSISLLSARFHSIPCFSFAKRVLAVPSRCAPPQFSSILSNSSAAHAYSIPFPSQSFMYHADLLLRQASPLRATQVYSLAGHDLSELIRCGFGQMTSHVNRPLPEFRQQPRPRSLP